MKHSTLLFSFIFSMVACSEYSLDEKIEPNLGEDTATVENDNNAETEPSNETSEPEDPVNENAPFADCSVAPNPVTPPFTAAVWDGSGSYDPSGEEIVMYYWELIERPEGSAATLPYGSGIQVSGFYADLAGDYIAELTVTNES